MSITAIRKHLVQKDYFDYGSPLSSAWGTADSVDNSGPIGFTEYRSKTAAEAAIETWLASDACEQARREVGWKVERGENVHRSVDMNPHGLI